LLGGSNVNVSLWEGDLDAGFAKPAVNRRMNISSHWNPAVDVG